MTDGQSFRILGIETSCDETAASVVADGANVLSSVVSSQVDLHARFGGVVPEIASRAHLDLLMPVVAEALVEAGVDGPELGAVAATIGPGLIGSLLVGVSAAKAMARNAKHLTLEVRVSNEPAQAMYRRFGFKPAGIRKNYYVETNEDALVMWAEDINTPEYRVRLERIEAEVPGTTVVVDDVRPTS